MIVCNRCGKENQDHYKFCLGCGAELTAPGKGGGDMAMMKTMMADTSGMTAQPPGGGRPLPGMGPPPGGGGLPGMPPPGMGPGPGPGPLGGMGGPGPLPPPPGFPPPQGPGSFGGPPPGVGGMGGAPLPPPPGFPGGPGPGLPPLGPPPGPMSGGMPGMGGPPPGMGGMGGPGPMGPPPGMGGMGGPMGPPPGLGGMGGPMGGMGPGPMGPPPAGPPPGVPPGVPMGGFAPAPGASVPGAVTGPRRCPQCSSDVPPGFRFCGACGFRMDEVSQPAIMPMAPPPMAPPPVQARPEPKAMLTLIRPDGSEGGTHTMRQGENKIGRNFGSLFETDGYLSPVHAELQVNLTTASVKDLESLNGVFVKMVEPEEILPGQIIRLGQELLRFDLIQPPDAVADGTEVMGSPNPGYWGKITVIIGREVDGACFPLLGDEITLGRERGEINFPDDGYVSGLHARITARDGRVFLEDLGSSNGTFVKVQGERGLVNESFVLMGQQLFRVNLSA